jgi:hypothetical protein
VGGKVPRQCPLDLLTEVRLETGKALGNETGESLRYGICYDQGLCCIRLELILILTWKRCVGAELSPDIGRS